MKKLFYVLAVATVATLTACGGGETKEEAKPATDSSAMAPATDSSAMAPATTTAAPATTDTSAAK